MPAHIGFDFNWLLDKPRDVAVVFAARMALRVAPLLTGVRGMRGGAADDFGEYVALPVFRATAAAWVAGQYPAHGAAMAHAADAACSAASFVAYGPRSAPLASARSTANAASRAAGVAAASGDPNAVFHEPDAGPGAVYACLAAAETTTPADFGAAARADSEMIDKGESASALAALPLWLAGRPDWAPEAWKRLEETLLAEDQDWRVWTDWYRARLEGEAANEALEVARVLIADDMWQQGPRAVNAEIARLIAEHGKAAG
jgi:hypothetical protein